MSSDSPLFDRYHHFTHGRRLRVGSLAVPQLVRLPERERSRAARADYDGWFGFDSIPVLPKTQPGRPGATSSRATIDHAALAQARRRAAGGWTCPATRRSRTATGRRSAASSSRRTRTRSRSSETWQKDTTLLRDPARRPARHDDELPAARRGDRPARAAGRSTRRASPTAAGSSRRRSSPPGSQSIREDYPDAAYYSAMNLLDSHDTERLLWTLTPGAETRGRRGAERGERRRGQAAAAARLADPVHACPARRPSTTATRSASPATTTRTTGARTRGPTWAAARTRRCSRTTRRWPRCAARTRR